MHKNIKTITIIKHLLRRPLLSLQGFLQRIHLITTTGLTGTIFWYIKISCIVLGILSFILIHYFNIQLQNYINLAHLAGLSVLGRFQTYLTQFVNYIVDYLGYEVELKSPPKIENIKTDIIKSLEKSPITDANKELANEFTLDKLAKALKGLENMPNIKKESFDYESLRDLYVKESLNTEESWTEWLNNHKKTIYIVGGVIIFLGVIYWSSDGSYEVFSSKFKDLTTGLFGFFFSSNSRVVIEPSDKDDNIIINDVRTTTQIESENPEIQNIRKQLSKLEDRKDTLVKNIDALTEKQTNKTLSSDELSNFTNLKNELKYLNNQRVELSQEMNEKINEIRSSFFDYLNEKEKTKLVNTSQDSNYYNSTANSVKKIWSELGSLFSNETSNVTTSEEIVKTSEEIVKTSDKGKVKEIILPEDCDSNKAWSTEHSPAVSDYGSRPSSPVASTSKNPVLNDGEETPALVSTPKTKPSDLNEDDNPYFVTVEELKKQSYYNGKQYSIWKHGNTTGEIMENLQLAEKILKDSGLSESEKEDLESRLKNYENLLSKKYREEDDSQKDFTPLHWNKAFKQPLIVENLPTIEPEKWSDEDEIILKKLLENKEITEAQYNEIREKCVCLPSDETLEKYKKEHQQWINLNKLFGVYKNLLNPKIDESNDCSEDANTSLISDTSTVVDDTSEIEAYDETFKAIKSRDYSNVSYYFSDNNYFEVFDDVEMYKEVKKTNELNDPIKKVLEDKLKIIYEPNELQDILEYFKTDYFDEKNLKNYDPELFKNVYLKLKENNDIEEIPESLRNRAIELGIENNPFKKEQLGLITLFLSKFLSKKKIKKLNKIENITEDQMNDIDKLLVMNHERILANLNLDQLNYYVELCKILDIEITKDMQHVLDCYKKDPEGTLKIHKMLLEFNERSNDLYFKNVEIITTPLEENKWY
jgi:hypothetical protein